MRLNITLNLHAVFIVSFKPFVPQNSPKSSRRRLYAGRISPPPTFSKDDLDGNQGQTPELSFKIGKFHLFPKTIFFDELQKYYAMRE
jgi:hypothetical protein